MTFLRKFNLKVLGTIIFLFLFLFANVYSVRQMARYGVELYFYDKMFVAYQVGGLTGLRTELNQVLSQEKLRSVIKLADDFKNKLTQLDDPGKFLNDITVEKKNSIKILKNSRTAVFGVILLIILSRFIISRYNRSKARSSK